MLIASLVLGVAALCPRPAAAQPPQTAEPSAAPSISDLEGLAKTLENDAERQRLLAEVRALIAAARSAEPPAVPPTLGERLIDAARETAEEVRAAAAGAVSELDEGGRLSRWIARNVHDPAWQARQTETLAWLAAILAGGFVGRLLARWAIAGPVRAAAAGPVPAGYRRWLLAAAHTALAVAPPLVFGLTGYAVLIAVSPPTHAAALALACLFAIAGAEVLLAVVRGVMMPPADGAAPAIGAGLYPWVRRSVIAVAAGWLLSEVARDATLPASAVELILESTGLLIAVLTIAAILCLRAPVAAWLDRRPAGSDVGSTFLAPFLAVFARVWHLPAIGYVVLGFLVWASGVPDGIATMAGGTALTALIAVSAGFLWQQAARLGSAGPGDHPAGDHGRWDGVMRQRSRRYLPMAAAVLQAGIGIAAVLAVLEAWGLPALGWLGHPVGQRLVAAAVSIALVLLIATAVWEVAGATIEARLAGVATDAARRERTARLRTLLPLARRALLVLLIVVVTLLVLSELGFDITPLLAGAGVIGLAIGFGSQTLVKDIITGVFMLIEDALSVGDVVTVAGATGVVESLSIRSIRLRDVSGNVHTIPFSSVGTVTNMTKTFSFALHDVAVAYEADLEKVMDVCREVVKDMRTDPVLGPMILEPLEMLGVDRFEEAAIILRSRTKTRPGNQWMVGRAFNLRLKRRLDALGIAMPFPQRTVQLTGGLAGGAGPAERGAATRAAIGDSLLPPAPASSRSAEYFFRRDPHAP